MDSIKKGRPRQAGFFDMLIGKGIIDCICLGISLYQMLLAGLLRSQDLHELGINRDITFDEKLDISNGGKAFFLVNLDVLLNLDHCFEDGQVNNLNKDTASTVVSPAAALALTSQPAG